MFLQSVATESAFPIGLNHKASRLSTNTRYVEEEEKKLPLRR
jgi:hypothetical protein